MGEQQQHNREDGTTVVKYKRTKIDKIIYILLALGSTIVFLFDVFKDFIPESKWQLKFLVMIIGALSGFFTVLSFLWDKKFTDTIEVVDARNIQELDERRKLVEDNVKEIVEVLLLNERTATQQKLAELCVLYNIYKTKDNEIIKFADRRIQELETELLHVQSNGETSELEVKEYYEELDYLADKLEQVGPSGGSIWAMTGFAPDEWSAAGGYEAVWSNRLTVLASKGICTTRVCLFSRTLLKTITDSNFKSPKKKDGRGTELDGLISLLQQYYQDPTATNCRHFVVCPGEFSELYKVKGFFGIELPDNEKHVILGEAINLDKGLTGKVLFNKDKIEAVHKDFVKAQQQDGREIINFLQINASDAFKEYLADKGIAAFKPVKVTR